MKNTPLKILLFSALLVSLALFSTACPQSVDMDAFLDSPVVQDVIEASPEGSHPVFLRPGSDDGLTAGNARITGLDRTKYYRVEEYNELDILVRSGFVNASGRIIAAVNFGDIGLVSGRTLTGLTGGYSYLVKSAVPLLTINTTLDYFETTNGTAFPISGTALTTSTADVTDNVAEIIIPDYKAYLILPSSGIALTNMYEIMQKGVSNWGSSFRTSALFTGSGQISNIVLADYSEYNPAKTIGMYQYNGAQNPGALGTSSIIELPMALGQTDYIFVQYDKDYNDTDRKIVGFQVLHVKTIPVPPDSADYGFTVTFSQPTEAHTLTITGATTINLAYGGSAAVTGSSAVAPSKISWMYDGVEIANTAGFTLNASDFGTNVYGRFQLTLYAEWGTPAPTDYGSAILTVNIAEP
jgi:hypothetical protein